MRETTRGRIDQLLETRKNSRSYLRMHVFAAVLLVFAVMMILIENGIAANNENRVLDCHYVGDVAHTHNADCYDANSNLVCTLPERELHTHDDSCYSETRKLVCGQEELDAHEHTDACYDEEGNLICGLEETEGHYHTDDCYEMVRELTCGKDELTKEHVHGPGCFVSADDDTAPVEAKMPAQEFTDTLKEINEDGEEEVVLTVAVKAPKGAFPAGTTMKIVDADEKDDADQLKEAVGEAVKRSDEDVTDIVWLKGVDIKFFSANEREIEPARKIEVKITHDKIRDIEEPILARTLDDAAKAKLEKSDDAEVLGKVKLVNQSDEDKGTGDENTLKFETDLPTTYMIAEAEYVEGHVAKPKSADDEVEDEAEEPAEPQIFTGEANGVIVTATTPAGALPEGTVLAVTSVEDEGAVKEQIDASVAGDGKQVDDLAAVSIGFTDSEGNAIVPEEQVQVNMKSSLMADAGHELKLMSVSGEPTTVEDARVDVEHAGAFSFESSELGSYAVVDMWTIGTQVITAGGETYNISVTYGPGSGIPENAKLEAREIVAGTDEYDDYCSQAEEALQLEDEAVIGFARFFDVNVMANGRKIEPTAPVEVRLVSRGEGRPDNADSLQIVHFADEGTEVIDPTVDDGVTLTTVTYQQGSFSVIGEVSTTNQYGWPTSNGQYVLVLQDGDNYYALNKDGSLKKVQYFGGTVTFMGAGTNQLSYIDDYLWWITTRNTRSYISDAYYEYGTPPAGSGTTFIDPSNAAGFSNAARQLSIQDRKIYANGQLPGISGYLRVSYSASNGELSRVELTDESASPIFFAKVDTFEADDNETELYDMVDVDALIERWRREISQELAVDKTAEVHDYENRTYRVDLTASAGYYMVSPSIALDFVVDASRSMYFPARLYGHGDSSRRYTTSGNGSGAAGIRNWIQNNADPNQTYYFITNPNSDATVYAIWYDTTGTYDVYGNGQYDRRNWRYAEASYYHTEDSTVIGKRGAFYGPVFADGSHRSLKQYDPALGEGWDASDLTELNRYSYDGYIYTTDAKVEGQPWNRLDYLKLAVQAAADVIYAVDADARIGLTKFAAEATHLGTWGNDQADQFRQALSEISVIGGTNHKLALDTAKTELDRANADSTHQQVVVLVTDGAPRGTTWDDINASAAVLRNVVRAGKPTALYTLGLSLEHVGPNKDNLFAIAGIGNQTNLEDYHYNAESGAEIVDCITKIVENMVIQADLYGNVTDVIDPAFYPVDTNGAPLAQGDYINLQGQKVSSSYDGPKGQLSYDATTKAWTVTWGNQRIDWPQTDGGGNVTSPGWHGTVYVKTKEDFLGGNGVNTNLAGSKVDATHYVNAQGESVPLENGSSENFAIPYVNVDELAFTEHGTTWTVYLGEEVDPKTELQKLWENVKVQEVVTKSDADHVIDTAGGLMVYSYQEDASDNRTPIAERKPEEFYLSDVVGALDWDELIANGKVEVPYGAYDHDGVGEIEITLTQNQVGSEPGLTDAAHATVEVGTLVETYTLTATYKPADASVSDYHTGSYGTARRGDPTGQITSTNTHVINVFAKRLQLYKVDSATGQPITSDSARFTLYRPVEAGGEAVEGLPTGSTYEAVAELETATTATATAERPAGWTDPTGYLPVGSYWLVETEAPDGYVPAEPVEVEIVLSEDEGATVAVLVDAAGDALYDRPIGWNWGQQAALNIKDSSDAVLHGKTPGAANEPDSETAVVQYDIKNSSGVELPHSGGRGVYDLYATGIAMIAGALAYLIFRGRKMQV